jgi:hypothetical protein
MDDTSRQGSRINPDVVSQLGEIALRHSAQVLIADFFPEGPKINSATATLLQIGSKRLAVTCQHVIAKHRKVGTKRRPSLFQIGNLAFEPLNERIVEEPKLDLATIELSDFQADQIIRRNVGTEKAFLVPVRWPPNAVTTADSLGIGGYPGDWRFQGPGNQVEFNGYSIAATPVTSVSEFTISCQFARDHWNWVGKKEGLKDPIGLGGMSGGPAFVWRESPVLHWEFAAFVYEFNCNIDVMLLRPAALVGEDGSITSPPWTSTCSGADDDDDDEQPCNTG